MVLILFNITQFFLQFILKQRVSVLALLLALSEGPQQCDSTLQLFPVPFLATVSINVISKRLSMPQI